MKHSSRQFGNYFSGFGRQSEKFGRIGACIRRNFMACNMQILHVATWIAKKYIYALDVRNFV